MQVVRRHPLLVFVLLVTACSRNEPSKKIEACRISGGVWHGSSAAPPHRVASWDVYVRGEDLFVNGRRKKIFELQYELASARDFRPSPYLIMHKEAGTSCDHFHKVAKALDGAIDCKRNYCFYSGGGR